MLPCFHAANRAPLRPWVPCRSLADHPRAAGAATCLAAKWWHYVGRACGGRTILTSRPSSTHSHRVTYLYRVPRLYQTIHMPLALLSVISTRLWTRSRCSETWPCHRHDRLMMRASRLKGRHPLGSRPVVKPESWGTHECGGPAGLPDSTYTPRVLLTTATTCYITSTLPSPSPTYLTSSLFSPLTF